MEHEAVYLIKMKAAAARDSESGHIDADDILFGLLRELGYNNLIDEYEELTRWFA